MFEWMILLLGGLCEVAWAQSLKLSNGFAKTIPTIIMVIFGILSCYLLALSERLIPLGVAYAVWSGIGGVGILLLGYYWHGETITIMQLFFTTLVIIGIIGVKLSS